MSDLIPVMQIVVSCPIYPPGRGTSLDTCRSCADYLGEEKDPKFGHPCVRCRFNEAGP